MTVSEQPPEYDTAMLTAALDHAWAWYDGRLSRAFQVINYYFLAIAVLGAAYGSNISGENYTVAAAIAVGGLALTTVVSATVFREVRDATKAEPVLAELQERVGGRLRLDSPMQIANPKPQELHNRVALNIERYSKPHVTSGKSRSESIRSSAAGCSITGRSTAPRCFPSCNASMPT
jgi:hypothetical protein